MLYVGRERSSPCLGEGRLSGAELQGRARSLGDRHCAATWCSRSHSGAGCATSALGWKGKLGAALSGCIEGWCARSVLYCSCCRSPACFHVFKMEHFLC